MALGDVTAERLITQLQNPSSRTSVEDVAAIVHVLVGALVDVTTGPVRSAGEQWLARIYDAFRAAPPAQVLATEAGVAQLLAALLQVCVGVVGVVGVVFVRAGVRVRVCGCARVCAPGRVCGGACGVHVCVCVCLCVYIYMYVYMNE